MKRNHDMDEDRKIRGFDVGSKFKKDACRSGRRRESERAFEIAGRKDASEVSEVRKVRCSAVRCSAGAVQQVQVLQQHQDRTRIRTRTGYLGVRGCFWA